MSDPTYSIQEIATGVFLLRMPLPFRLDHINLYLLEDVDGWLLIDSGLNTGTTKTLWSNFLESGFFQKPLRKIVLTHLHPDHIGMSSWLSEKLNIPVLISSEDWNMVNFLWGNEHPDSKILYQEYWNSFGVTDSFQAELVETRLQYRKLVKEIPKNVQILSGKETLLINENNWVFIMTPGHSPGHLCLWNERQRILISGDQVLPTITPNISYHPTGLINPLDSYLRSLEQLLNLDCLLYLPAHGPACSNLNERIQQIIQHHQERLSLLLDNIGSSKTVHQALTIIFPQQLPTHQLMFAYAETAAHLLYLANKQLITKGEQSPWIFRNENKSINAC